MIVDMFQNKPHYVSEVICVKCFHRYIAAFPRVTLLKDLDCPNCGQGYIISTGQIISEDN